jgi:hypothetical protein
MKAVLQIFRNQFVDAQPVVHATEYLRYHRSEWTFAASGMAGLRPLLDTKLVLYVK